VNWFDEGKDTLARRVAQIQTGIHWAEEPPSRTCHMVSNVQIVRAAPAGPAPRRCSPGAGSSSIAIAWKTEDRRARRQARRTCCAGWTDRWKITRRMVILDQRPARQEPDVSSSKARELSGIGRLAIERALLGCRRAGQPLGPSRTSGGSAATPSSRYAIFMRLRYPSGSRLRPGGQRRRRRKHRMRVEAAREQIFAHAARVLRCSTAPFDRQAQRDPKDYLRPHEDGVPRRRGRAEPPLVRLGHRLTGRDDNPGELAHGQTADPLSSRA